MLNELDAIGRCTLSTDEEPLGGTWAGKSVLSERGQVEKMEKGKMDDTILLVLH